MPAWTTYRVQLHAGFDFRAVAEVADYLADLGVTHLYCSPYLQAAPGSTHGYDVADPRRLSAELGGATGHAELVAALRRAGLGQVLDIVPNHMAAHRSNPWWWDVLENGPASRYAAFFDIDWEGGDHKSSSSVLVPILEDHYGRVLEDGGLVLCRRGGSFLVRYEEHELPLSPGSLAGLLNGAARQAGSARLALLAEELASLSPARAGAPVAAQRDTRRRALTEELGRLCDGEPAVGRAVDGALAAVSADVERLDDLLCRQHYRLAHWRTAGEELDYRRFFNIETLIGIRPEVPEVFEETHRLILELVGDGTLQGLRVDHVDGLRDPQGYLERLAHRTGGVYTVVEKILERGEVLPERWPVAGTTGYDFVARVGNLFVDRHNEAAMTECYTAFTGECGDFGEVARAAKEQVMRQELAAEVERVTALVADVADHHRRHRDHTRRALRDALREFVARFPVYRVYVRPGRPPAEDERARVAEAVRDAMAARPDIDRELLAFIGELALGQHAGARAGEVTIRLQQLTAPVMAKGVEDTAFYRYNRLVSLNEVGGEPGVFGRPATDFHCATAATAARWPDTMLTLSTHDTKRSADVRARLHVLSEIPGPWRRAVERWAEGNERHRCDGWPDRDAEYLLYQTLVGAWPVDAGRVGAFMDKAAREAKRHTSWTDPDEGYDAALAGFVGSVLADTAFTADVERFLQAEQVVARGRRNALAQTALLLTCPGIPDIYQGSELWDLSLVDPDNRRPVDYRVRRRLLTALRDAGEGGPPGEVRLLEDDRGSTKLRLVHRLLSHRRDHGEAYRSACYEPLGAEGGRAEDVLAFCRGELAVVVPRGGDDRWDATTVDLGPGHWTDVVTGSPMGGGRRAVGELLARFPVAVLHRGR